MKAETIKSKWMRGIALLAVVLVGAYSKAQTSSTVKDDLFAGTEMFAKNATGVTEISMDPDTLGMVGGPNSRRAHNMILNVVRTYEYDKPGMYRMEDVETFRNKLNTGEWHCSVHVRDMKRGESTDVCSKKRTDDLAESAIITVEPQELTFIHQIRRRSAEDHSLVGGFMMLDSLGSLPALARLEPELMGLNMQLENMQLPNEAAIEAQVNAAMAGARAQMSSADMQNQMEVARKALEEARKNLNSPEIQKRLEDAEKQLEKGNAQVMVIPGSKSDKDEMLKGDKGLKLDKDGDTQ